MMARGRHVTVTEIATALGFVELGRFSVEYRRAFGESPSETLRQAFREHGGDDSASIGRVAFANELADQRAVTWPRNAANIR